MINFLIFGMNITKYDKTFFRICKTLNESIFKKLWRLKVEVVSYNKRVYVFYVLKHGDVVSFDAHIYVVFLRCPDQGDLDVIKKNS